MIPKKIVLLTEGHGEESAAPVLIKRLLAERQAAHELTFVDEEPFRVGQLPKIAKSNFNMRSFRRLENAVDEMIVAFRENRHFVSPTLKPWNGGSAERKSLSGLPTSKN